MDNGKSRGRKKIVFQMLVMVCILAIAGYFMQAKMMEFGRWRSLLPVRLRIWPVRRKNGLTGN